MPKKPSSTKYARARPRQQQQQQKQPRQEPTRVSSSAVVPENGSIGLGPTTQQLILNIFAEAFASHLSSASFAPTLQEVKQALFDRDFVRAFGSEAYLEVYAARYSPTRALCYAEALLSISEHLARLEDGAGPGDPAAAPAPAVGDVVDVEDAPDIVEGDADQSVLATAAPDSTLGRSHLKVVSIGGGPAEVAAFATYLRQKLGGNNCGSLGLLDSGPWEAVVRSVHARCTTPPTLSKYASAEAKAANSAFIPPSRMRVTFRRADALSLGKDGLSELFGGAATPAEQQQRSPLLVTLFFTLNELFATGGIGKTTAFLLDMTAAVPAGSLLLVVDSPGSYSETVVGRQSKKYPMHWLLGKVLSTAATESCAWVMVESHESLWFRLPEALSYPISLENMRYQMHLYRAITPHLPST